MLYYRCLNFTQNVHEDDDEEEEEEAVGRFLRRCWLRGMPRCADR